jgi:hypothetical protein
MRFTETRDGPRGTPLTNPPLLPVFTAGAFEFFILSQSFGAVARAKPLRHDAFAVREPPASAGRRDRRERSALGWGSSSLWTARLSPCELPGEKEVGRCPSPLEFRRGCFRRPGGNGETLFLQLVIRKRRPRGRRTSVASGSKVTLGAFFDCWSVKRHVIQPYRSLWGGQYSCNYRDDTTFTLRPRA